MALSELGSHTSRARTAFWCALQMASRDLPLQCMKVADSSAWLTEFTEGHSWLTATSATDEDVSFDVSDASYNVAGLQ